MLKRAAAFHAFTESAESVVGPGAQAFFFGPAAARQKRKPARPM
jgi:hypothetical protein